LNFVGFYNIIFGKSLQSWDRFITTN